MVQVVAKNLRHENLLCVSIAERRTRCCVRAQQPTQVTQRCRFRHRWYRSVSGQDDQDHSVNNSTMKPFSALTKKGIAGTLALAGKTIKVAL